MAKITNGADRALSFELEGNATVTLEPGGVYSGKAAPVIHSEKWRAGMEARGVVFDGVEIKTEATARVTGPKNADIFSIKVATIDDSPAKAAQKPASKRSAKPAPKAEKPADAAPAPADGPETDGSSDDAA